MAKNNWLGIKHIISEILFNITHDKPYKANSSVTENIDQRHVECFLLLILFLHKLIPSSGYRKRL